MHEIVELEKRWLQYKFKKWIVHLSIFTIIFIAVLLFLFVDFLKLSPSNQSQSNDEAIVAEKIEQNIDADALIDSTKNEQSIQPHIATQNRKVILQAYEPKINLSNRATREKNAQSIQEETLVLDKSLQNQTDSKETQTAQKSSTTAFNTSESKSNNLDILTRSENELNPQVIEQRFNETNNIRHAIFLAKYYYDNKEYEKSYKWAFTVNQLDPTSEEGWLFFAKSLYKLDRKDDAIKVLKNYLNHYRSQVAQDTLRQIIQEVL